MARRVTVELVDDYDSRSVAQETVLFAVDGVGYEIDLSLLNGARLRGVFERWTPHARETGRVSRRRSGPRPSADGGEPRKVRDWARAQGMAVSSRGRISAEVVQAYEKASR